MVRRMLRQAEVLRGLRRAGGDDVPAGPPAADMIQRGEQPRQIIRFQIGRGRRRDQPDAAGDGGDRRQPCDRLDARARRITDIVRQCRPVGKKHRIEFRELGALRQVLIIADVEHTLRRGPFVSPSRFVMTARINEQVQCKLATIGHDVGPPNLETARN